MNAIHKTLSDEQLRIERSRYNTLVQSEILQLNSDENYVKKNRNMIIFTVVTVLIPCWLSSSKDSNLYWIINRLVGEKYADSPLFYLYSAVFFLLPVILLIAAFSFELSVKNIKRNFSENLLLKYLIQNQIFYSFIYKKLSINSENKTESEFFNEILAFYKNNNVQDITFTDNDLQSFLNSYLKKYKINFSINFTENYSKVDCKMKLNT